jgi:hypothetical protein
LGGGQTGWAIHYNKANCPNKTKKPSYEGLFFNIENEPTLTSKMHPPEPRITEK